jgi:hypothetical protein
VDLVFIFILFKNILAPKFMLVGFQLDSFNIEKKKKELSLIVEGRGRQLEFNGGIIYKN